MIKFGKNHKVENIGILEKEEAEAYVDFLTWERIRHVEEVGDARQSVKSTEHWRPKCWEATREFWQSAIKRHEEDIKAIDVLVETLKGFYGI